MTKPSYEPFEFKEDTLEEGTQYALCWGWDWDFVREIYDAVLLAEWDRRFKESAAK